MTEIPTLTDQQLQRITAEVLPLTDAGRYNQAVEVLNEIVCLTEMPPDQRKALLDHWHDSGTFGRVFLNIAAAQLRVTMGFMEEAAIPQIGSPE